MANPSANHQDSSAQAPSFYGVTNYGDNNGLLRHNPGISLDWRPEEQSILEQGLIKYAGHPLLICYAKISMELQDKTIRDIAFRCNWMKKKEISNGSKGENCLKRKSEDDKLSTWQNVPPYAPSVSLVDYDDDGDRVIGGVTGVLFERNEQAFNRIAANFSTLQIIDNLNLLCQARDNLLKITYDLNGLLLSLLKNHARRNGSVPATSSEGKRADI
ncbi:uncharacterized protein LOC120006271 isoform X2 [Tripterygium wilfordii]|uniref:uncharacterized protein LOC120006271 isoform X2 n=1 Tax=Tripterygium wilfordii TaxID=458696 RepID=UPI0018F7F3E8|nr:uncharacterized protein LOC120006271 isoform X2 [Tripterygium wilfordii]